MIMISDDKFQEIIDKTDIVGLVSEFVELTKKGNGYFGLCPFHDDSSPSFSVSVDKKIAKCMSCGEGGNPITFLKKAKKISTNEAISILAQRANVEIDLNIAPKKEDKNQKYYDIYKVAQEFYSYNLFNSQSGKKALEYLYKRGLTEETIKSFGIGLAPNAKDTLTKVLIDNKFLDIDCIEVGLIKNNGTYVYDIFMNRIMFPITNENGQTIAFSGRLFDDSNGPKYVNTMETVIYRKGDHLYNLSNAITQINRTKRVILCEGQMDAIKISNANLKDVVCALGSALTANQVKLIRKYATNVVLAYDNDNAGIKATKTAINLLKGLTIDVLQLPVGIDPDEFITKNSVEEFNKLFDNRINSIEFIYNSYFIDKNIYSLVHVEEIKNNVFKYIKTISSNTIKEQLFNKLSSDLKINYENLLKDYNMMNGVKPSVQKQTNRNNNYYDAPPNMYEPPVSDYYDNHIPDEYLNQAPPQNFHPYTSEAPPESFGNGNFYEDINYDLNQNINKKPQGNYKQSTTQLNVVKVDENKKNSKKFLDACKNIIALSMLKSEYYRALVEKAEGNDIELYLAKPYNSIYGHLKYLKDEFPSISIREIHAEFVNSNFKEIPEYDVIVNTVNSYSDDDKRNKRILFDAITTVMNVHNESVPFKKLENALTDQETLASMNELLFIKREIDKNNKK